jgi:hypothetical protein
MLFACVYNVCMCVYIYIYIYVVERERAGVIDGLMFIVVHVNRFGSEIMNQ